MRWLNKWLAELPSTNGRIAVTLFIALATTARYLASGLPPGPVPAWEPSWEWLIFIAAMAGLDVAQFAFKRNTYAPSPPAPPDIEDAAAKREVVPLRSQTVVVDASPPVANTPPLPLIADD